MTTSNAAVEALRAELKALLVERDEVVDATLAALLSSHHVLLIGPPGTAKSMLAEQLCRRIRSASYFQWLLTRFTTPEELFGAISLRGLEQDEYRRVTDHKLPTAHVAFLDEVFKGSSSILNTLLTLLNERKFHNGREVVDVPLRCLIGATNELPDEEELSALYDRFLVRIAIEPIREDFRFLQMLRSEAPGEARATLGLDELAQAQAEVLEVAVGDPVLRAIAELRRELAQRGIQASDRRYRQCLDWLRACAYLAGRDAVAVEDLMRLEHVLWNEPRERSEVAAALHQLLRGQEEEGRKLLFQSRELHAYAMRSWETEELRTRAVVEAHTKIRDVVQRLETLASEARERGRGSGVLEETLEALASEARERGRASGVLDETLEEARSIQRKLVSGH